MLIYLIRKEKLDIFHYSKKKIRNLTEKEAQKWYYFFEKKLGVLSRELLTCVKKRYPMVEQKELTKMLFFEAQELSPYPNFDFSYRIGKSGTTYVEIEFWFWDKGTVDVLKNKGFSFTHLLPEDFLYSQKNTLFVFLRETFVYLLAHGDRVTNSIILPSPLEIENLKLFLKTLSDIEVKEIWIYRDKREISLTMFEEIFGKDLPKIVYKKDISKDLPKFLENINLKAFKIKKELPIRTVLIEGLRILAWLVLAIAFNLYLSIFSYDRGIQNLKEKIRKIEEEEKKMITSEKMSLEREEFTQQISELKEELKKMEKVRTKDIMFLLDSLAKVLPDGASLKSFELKEKKLTLVIQTKDVIETVREIKKLEIFQEIKIPSAPLFDRTQKTYSFRLETTLK